MLLDPRLLFFWCLLFVIVFVCSSFVNLLLYCLEIAERLLQRSSFVAAARFIACLNNLLLQARFAHKIVGERADLGRLLFVVGELLDIRVRRIVDDQRFERSVFPLENGGRSFPLAEKLAREPAFALAIVGGDARCDVNILRRRSPIFNRLSVSATEN